jgi:hypothetical protein
MQFQQRRYGVENKVYRAGILLNDIRARICEPYKVPRNRFPPGGPVRQPYLTYRPAGLQVDGIDSLELIHGLFKRLQIRARCLK